jgi:hypothetical protein
MYDACDPYIFYLRVRPFVAGWKGAPSLPNGLVYKGNHMTNDIDITPKLYLLNCYHSVLLILW